MSELKEGEDYYVNEDGLFVFTEAYHLMRGYCCRSGCRHCPYGYVGDNRNAGKKTLDELEERKDEWNFDV